MPYFVYRVEEPKKLQHLDTKEKFQEAKSLVRSLRAEQADDDQAIIRMIFARNTSEAEKLLSAPKDERIIGEE